MLIDFKTPHQHIISKIFQLTGQAIINAIADLPNPDAFIGQLPADDFYRMIKRIGYDDCLPILQLASVEQWQHLLDLDIWKKDRMDVEQTLQWLAGMAKADSQRFSSWALEDQSQLIALTLTQTADIFFREDQDDSDIPPGYQTLDGSFYFKSREVHNAQTIHDVMAALAQNAPLDYPNLLLSLPAVIPAETEEELYRLRNNRIAEYGFPSYDEAVAIYAPLEVTALPRDKMSHLPGRLATPESDSLIPSTPWMAVSDFPFLAEGFAGITDPLQADRIRLEFAVLCNTLIVADTWVGIDDEEDLVRISRKAAGYMNIAVEKICAEQGCTPSAVLTAHALQTLFRAGFGEAMRLQWRAKRWLEKSWFFSQRKPLSFWGIKYMMILEAILQPRPCYVAQEQNPPYRHFENNNELNTTADILGQITALDKMLSRMAGAEGNGNLALADCETFYPILFNRWAQDLLNHRISFAPLSSEEARAFFRLLREGETVFPYTMEKYRNAFMEAFMKSAVDFNAEEKKHLTDALHEIWSDFSHEYERVALADLDARFSVFLKISRKETEKRTRNKRLST